MAKNKEKKTKQVHFSADLNKLIKSLPDSLRVGSMDQNDKALKAAARGETSEFVRLAMDADDKNEDIQHALGVRYAAIMKCEFQFEPYDDSPQAKEIAEFMSKAWKHLPKKRDMLRNALAADYFGFSLQEMVPVFDEQRNWYSCQFKYVPLENLIFYHDEKTLDYPRLLTGESNDSIDLTEYKDRILFHTRSKHGSFLKGGIARILLWLALFAKFSRTEWIGFIETWAKPILIGKEKDGYSMKKDDMEKLEEALLLIFSNSRAIIPSGVDITTLDAKRSGSSAMFAALHKQLQQSINKVILGQTETTNSDGGSRAKATIQLEVQDSITDESAENLAEILSTQWVHSMVQWNYGLDEYRFPTMIIRKKKKVDVDGNIKKLEAAKNVKLPVAIKSYYEMLGIPQPGEDDELIEYPEENQGGEAKANDGNILIYRRGSLIG